MILRLSADQLVFLSDVLEYGQLNYEDRATRYLYGPQALEGYRENEYLPKLAMFKELKKALRGAK